MSNDRVDIVISSSWNNAGVDRAIKDIERLPAALKRALAATYASPVPKALPGDIMKAEKATLQLAQASAKVQQEQNKAALSAQKNATEQQRTAVTAAQASTAQERHATAVANTSAASARAEKASLQLAQAQDRAGKAAQKAKKI